MIWFIVLSQPSSKMQKSSSTTSAGSRPRYHPYGCLQYARVLPKFQKKARKTRQCASEMAMCEAMRVTLKVQWRSWDVGKSRNMQRLRKASLRSHEDHKHWHYCRDGATQALWSSHFPTDCPAHWTWNCRGTHVCPAGFQSYFGAVPFYVPISTFWNKNVYSAPLYVESVQLSLHFHRDSQLVCL